MSLAPAGLGPVLAPPNLVVVAGELAGREVVPVLPHDAVNGGRSARRLVEGFVGLFPGEVSLDSGRLEGGAPLDVEGHALPHLPVVTGELVGFPGVGGGPIDTVVNRAVGEHVFLFLSLVLLEDLLGDIVPRTRGVGLRRLDGGAEGRVYTLENESIVAY